MSSRTQRPGDPQHAGRGEDRELFSTITFTTGDRSFRKGRASCWAMRRTSTARRRPGDEYRHRDAINLAWKLAACWRHAPDALLDSYEAERIAFARRLVPAPTRLQLATAEGPVADFLRTRVAPLVIKP